MGNLKDMSRDQALMYTGAAAMGVLAGMQAFAPKQYDNVMYGNIDIRTPPGCQGDKQRAWHAYGRACLGAFQATSAYEKPTSSQLAMAGTAWGGAAALTGVHAFKDNATKPEVAIPLMLAQAGMSALMITRSVRLRKDTPKKV